MFPTHTLRIFKGTTERAGVNVAVFAPSTIDLAYIEKGLKPCGKVSFGSAEDNFTTNVGEIVQSPVFVTEPKLDLLIEGGCSMQTGKLNPEVGQLTEAQRPAQRDEYMAAKVAVWDLNNG